MKRLSIFIFLSVLFSYVKAQDSTSVKFKIPYNENTKSIEFSKIVKEKGSKRELFNRCVYWLYDYYKDPVRVSRVRDLNSGKIAGQHYFYIYKQDSITNKKEKFAKIIYSFTIKFKDNKYMWQINKLESVSKSKIDLDEWMKVYDPKYKKEWEYYLGQIIDFVNGWSAGLEKKMSEVPSAKKNNDDW